MTERFSAGSCRKCGATVGFENGVRQDTCRCDPQCEACGRQFLRGVSGYVCDDCLEEEIAKEFSQEFLSTLSGKQFGLLMRDFTKRYE
jgi:ribosomal protein L34E